MTGWAILLLQAAAVIAPKSVIVGPDACPVEASAETYEWADEVEDLNIWRGETEGEILFKDVFVGESGVRFRLYIDPETGQALSAPVEDCPTQ